MSKKSIQKIARVDYVLLTCVFILLVLGAAMVYSASSFKAEQTFGSSSFYLQKQIVRIIIGIILMFIVVMVDYRKWLGLSPIFYVVALFLLLLLFTQLPIVLTTKGASRWLRIGSFTFQPSDFARYALIMVLARLLYKKRETLDDFWGGYMKIMGVVMVIVIPIAFERDLGTAVLVTLIAFTMFFFAQVRISYLLATGLTCVSGGILYMMRNSYQKSRFDHFVNLLLGRGEPGWQVKQSLISISQGGWFGKGLGNSQQKYNFLPEAHKDFIFAVIGEELGLTGSVGVLIIFFIIIYRGIRIAQRAPNGYGQLLAGGITACIGLYALINAGVAVAILPTTGLPMPFLSYGGSALVTHLVAIGLLINISIQGSNSYINQVDWPVYNKRLNRRKL